MEKIFVYHWWKKQNGIVFRGEMHLKVSHWRTVSSLRKISDKTVGFKCTLKETFINLKLKNFTKILLKLFKVSFIMAPFFIIQHFFSWEYNQRYTDWNHEDSKYSYLDKTSKFEWRRSTKWIYSLLADGAFDHSWICCVSIQTVRRTESLIFWLIISGMICLFQ